jgi:drug/metabolite transporter (DMT)-like permease
MPQILTIRGTVLLGAEKTAVFGSAELITALIVGWVILAEPVRTAEIVGASLLIAAILLRYRH